MGIISYVTPIECSKCGSRHVARMVNLSHQLRCLDCGHEKSPPESLTEFDADWTSWRLNQDTVIKF